MIKKKQSLVDQTLFTLPALLCFIPIVIIPFLYAIYMSFLRWNGISATKEFIGLLNFKNIFTNDPEYWQSLWFSIKFTVSTTLISNFLGLSLALLVYSLSSHIQGLFRTLFLLPNVMGGVIMGFIWRFIFQKVFVAISDFPLLGFLNQSWLGEPTPAFWSLVIVSVWQYAGYTMIIYIAGLTGIDKDIKEAARIDGCTSTRELFGITLPLIMPSITICIFWVMVKSFTMYDLASALTQGGPYQSTMTVSMELYAEAFTRNNYGLGSAKALVFFIFILIISFLQVRFTKSREVDA